MALDKLKERYTDFDWVCVGRSEIDKYAILAANAVYPQYADRNYGDISKIDWGSVPDFDLFTYSFPCQDISQAGLHRGLKEGSGTRSSLLWECQKAIEAKHPAYMLMENVKALTQKKFLPYLRKWVAYLDGLGYKSYMKVLNAKDYGVPQNRERTFVVSIIGNKSYEFPCNTLSNSNLGNILDNNVDEKYYLKNKIIHIDRKDPLGKDIKIMQVTNILGDKGFKNPQRGRVYDPNGLSPTLDTMRRGNGEPKIITRMPKFLGYTRDSTGKVVKRHFMAESNTIHTSTGNGGNTDCFVAEPILENGDYYVRRLTPRECFRLMGVSEDNIDKIQQAGISNSQQYKMAGNSIVVDVLYHIFRKMFVDKSRETAQLTLF